MIIKLKKFFSFCFLNLQQVGFLLIGVAVYGIQASIVTNLPIIGGILACGVILILISILGLAGAYKHHQVMLFFYMIILFLLFLIQFSIACSCLAVNSEQQKQLAEQGWSKVPDSIKSEVQQSFTCCGFNSTTEALTEHPSCDAIMVSLLLFFYFEREIYLNF